MFDIKELVQALFANREEEGVYDLKSATRLMGALPENQLLAAMNEIITALQKLNRNPRINTKERFRTIAYLDEKTHPLLQQLVAIYFGRTKDESTPPAKPC